MRGGSILNEKIRKKTYVIIKILNIVVCALSFILWGFSIFLIKKKVYSLDDPTAWLIAIAPIITLVVYLWFSKRMRYRKTEQQRKRAFEINENFFDILTEKLIRLVETDSYDSFKLKVAENDNNHTNKDLLKLLQDNLEDFEDQKPEKEVRILWLRWGRCFRITVLGIHGSKDTFYYVYRNQLTRIHYFHMIYPLGNGWYAKIA